VIKTEAEIEQRYTIQHKQLKEHGLTGVDESGLSKREIIAMNSKILCDYFMEKYSCEKEGRSLAACSPLSLLSIHENNDLTLSSR
jgi:hypothetical protein